MSTRACCVLAFGVLVSCGSGGSAYGTTDPGPVTSTAPIASIMVTPATVTVTTGGAAAFTATMKYASGVTVVGQPAKWTTNSASVATIDSLSGIAYGIAPGNATVTVTAEGKTGTATLSVTTGTGMTGYIRRGSR